MSNDRKSELLGLNYSSASSALRKQIIYHLAGVLGLLDCFRCGEEIELERFSIEHKESWMQADDPKATFFDMNNIAFSHLRCNVQAANRPIKSECYKGHTKSNGKCLECQRESRSRHEKGIGREKRNARHISWQKRNPEKHALNSKKYYWRKKQGLVV